MEKFINILKSGAIYFGQNPQGWEQDFFARLYFVIIASFVMLFIPFLITLIFPFLKKDTLSKKGSVILYAFVTGFFITMALFGFLRESLEKSSLSAKAEGFSGWSLYGWNILLVGGGLTAGLSFGWFLRFIVKKATSSKIKEDPKASLYIHIHDLSHDHEHEAHDHSNIALNHKISHKEVTNKKSDTKLKIVALLLLLTHRIPAGFLIGYSFNAFFTTGAQFGALNAAFLISFILHLIPEEIIFYYRQREMGISKWKAVFNSFASLLLFIPLMLLGIYLGKYINQIWQLSAFVQAMISGTFLFTAIIEFLPEINHAHHDKKFIKKVLFVFLLGIIICATILSFHDHGTYNF
ncbi:ZIP family metal transporter [Mycoplasmopsis lipofaciens]|uniref:ZIP family metal transporter n=1 Tax=Mycoplasmopsis lipofaciens TaxID=114884 RepID=UPI000486C398|nr:ZIP family metal transporter [Mycoplasmopsis lipofaciens]